MHNDMGGAGSLKCGVLDEDEKEKKLILPMLRFMVYDLRQLTV